METSTLGMLTLIFIVAMLAPFIADRLAGTFPIPSLVVEILLGVMLGPAVLGWVRPDDVIEALSELGLAALMFLAGYEIELKRTAGDPLRRAIVGWLMSLVLGMTAGMLIGGVTAGLVIGLALTTTALGTILPILRDNGQAGSKFSDHVLAVGAVGEFAPIVAIAFVLTNERPSHTIAVLVVFAALAITGAWLAHKPRHPRIARVVTATLGTSAQVAVRMCMLVLISMFGFASWLGLDPVLGAFTAGILIRLFLDASDRDEALVVESRLEGIGYGLLIPIFFVVSGVDLDVKSLFTDLSQLVMVPVFLALFLLVRGVPTFFTHLGILDLRDRLALSAFAATALPLVVVITTIGVDAEVITPARAAALVSAAVISVLVYPTIGLRLRQVANPRSDVTAGDDHLR
jgi:Kef-type K+ transport system membrane component KefB